MNRRTTMPSALTIAGSDSGGGAGIQADIKTMSAHGVFAMSAITAMTAQNTMGVRAIQESTPEFLAEQLDAVFNDIAPDAVKTGMVASEALILVIADRLAHYGARHVVVDPVMIATSGASLMACGAADTLKKRLMPLAELVTPNIPEAEALCGLAIATPGDMERAADRIAQACGCAVLLKGGHSVSDADDYLLTRERGVWLRGKRIDNPNTHGTGCTLSSAIASNLAKGMALEDAAARAKDYISGTLGAMLDLGKGSGPMNHLFDLKSTYIGYFDK